MAADCWALSAIPTPAIAILSKRHKKPLENLFKLSGFNYQKFQEAAANFVRLE